MGRLFAAAEGARVAVDGSGEVLREALPLRPWLVKPNRDELAQLYGVCVRTREEALPLARRLCSDGARNALVSLGEEGAVLACESGGEYAMPAFPGRAADTVGAGDSLLAGFIAAYEGGQSAEQALAQGVAAGCATAFAGERDGKLKGAGRPYAGAPFLGERLSFRPFFGEKKHKKHLFYLISPLTKAILCVRMKEKR